MCSSILLDYRHCCAPRKVYQLDGRTWHRLAFSDQMVCDQCGRDYPAPEPRLYQLQQPAGGLPGVRRLRQRDRHRHGPGRPRPATRSLREGAIAPGTRRPTPTNWKNCSPWPAITTCRSTSLSMNLTDAAPQVDLEGVPERNFGGLNGFFAWLERRKYKMHLRVFLSRWRSYRPVPRLQRRAICGPRRWRRKSAARTSPTSAAMKIRDAVGVLSRLGTARMASEPSAAHARTSAARLGYLGRSAWAI